MRERKMEADPELLRSEKFKKMVNDMKGCGNGHQKIDITIIGLFTYVLHPSLFPNTVHLCASTKHVRICIQNLHTVYMPILKNLHVNVNLRIRKVCICRLAA